MIQKYECEDCGHITNIKDNLERHRRLTHGIRKRKEKEDKRDSKEIENSAEDEKEQVSNTSVPLQRTTAINENVEKIEIVPATNGERYDLIHFIKEKKEQITELLLEKSEANNIKYFFNVQVRMVKYLADGTYEEALPHFRSRMKTLLSTRENFKHVF
ncbi:unnamed protein product [Mytilus coruscus]|uniref:C2H2-type domain-containing protein n=1 Tax=Mytilus coruscus TaxID=42192 RepID=A0A6J8ERY6_MYTCO|nr:unnamed protein product [Mytilus coruscus]